MANINEVDQFDNGVYQIEKTDPVLGGVGGIANMQAVNLANRTRYLFNRISEIFAQFAQKDSPAFTGSPQAPTAAQGNNTTILATTAFVQRALGSFSAFKIIADPAPKLDGSAIGCLLYLNATQSVVCTLPPLGSVPVGSAISLNSGMQSLTTTLIPAGKDVIYMFGQSGAMTPVLSSGDSAIAVSSGDAWNIMSGSLQWGKSAAFGALLGANGYQKLPSGLILQWGAVWSPGNGSAITFPIAFSNGGFRQVTGVIDATGMANAYYSWGISGISATGCTFSASGTAPTNNIFRYIAVGN
ncbi:gp53-like domain-containing protein [Burkholderia alba]|uniref:gp53-like domain-containing protein n=1 Tax=Burkholderia alba TaxID=2683677 RepID=UPI002B05AD47|nr:hypothetical protein [Burkholderia alba]